MHKKQYGYYWYYYKSVRKYLWRKPKIIGSFLEFGFIGYTTKRDKFKKKIMVKTFKAIKVGYTENHTRDTYKL